MQDGIHQSANSDNTIIAYEPIWAIGSGKVAPTSHVQDVHSFIKATLINTLGKERGQHVRVIYGGSLNQDNASDIFAIEEVDGGLIGGASLDALSFHNICKMIPTFDQLPTKHEKNV